MESPELLARRRRGSVSVARIASGSACRKPARAAQRTPESGGQPLMLRYVIRRVLYAIPILIGVFLVTFVLFYVAVPPEQMARRNLSAKNPTDAQIQEWLA